MFTEDYKTNI